MPSVSLTRRARLRKVAHVLRVARTLTSTHGGMAVMAIGTVAYWAGPYQWPWPARIGGFALLCAPVLLIGYVLSRWRDHRYC